VNTAKKKLIIIKYRLGLVAVQDVTWDERYIAIAIILSFTKG